jgi:SPP1 gp7 family putative phage head morphogenesis protein
MIRQVWAADGKSWSTRIWDNTADLAETLNEKLIECVVGGKKTSDLKKALMERFHVSFGRADALARTELAHIQTQAARQRYEDTGIEYVEIWADKDERRCEVCGKLHQKRYPVGAQIPIPAHPRCRCTIVPVVEIPEDKPVQQPQTAQKPPTRAFEQPKEQTYTPQRQELTQGEKDGVEYYVSGDGMYINHYLRDGDKAIAEMGAMRESDKKLIAALDKATDQKIEVGTVYRSVDASAVFGDMTDLDFSNLEGALLYGDSSKYAAAAKEKYLDGIIGKEITDNGFMSTTKSFDVANEFRDFTGSSKPVVIEFTDTDKARGLELAEYMPELNDQMEQDEILIKRKQKYKIVKIGKREGSIYIKAKFI